FAPRDTPDALRAKLEESEPEPLPEEESPAQENTVQVAAAEEDGADAAEKNGGFVGWVRRLFRSE
ncbi:MAG TPA: hypothetical protein VE782_00750, partial [Myxococcaceae bacterium]|nr:hypothetical protein [Myxococcaceae bacterium]